MNDASDNTEAPLPVSWDLLLTYSYLTSGIDESDTETIHSAHAWLDRHLGQLIEDVEGVLTDQPPDRAYELLNACLAPLMQRRRWQDVIRVGRAAISSAHRLGVLSAELHASQAVGIALQQLGDLTQATATFAEIVERAGTDETLLQRAQALAHLGHLSRLSGDLEGALENLHRARAAYERAEAPLGAARCAGDTAWVYAEMRHPKAASDAYEQALGLFPPETSKEELARQWVAYSGILDQCGDLDGAVGALERSREFFLAAGLRRESTRSLIRIAELKCAHWDIDAASNTIERFARLEILADSESQSALSQVQARIQLLLFLRQLIDNPDRRGMIVSEHAGLASPWLVKWLSEEAHQHAPLYPRTAHLYADASFIVAQYCPNPMLEVALNDAMDVAAESGHHVPSEIADMLSEPTTDEAVSGLLESAAQRITGGMSPQIRATFALHALMNRLNSPQVGDLQPALEICCALVCELDRDRDRGVWRRLHIGLGQAFRSATVGLAPMERAAKAVTHFRKALWAFPRRENTLEWGKRLVDLANAYGDHPTPNRQENLRRAASRLRVAISAIEAEEDDQTLGVALNNLGRVLMDEAAPGGLYAMEEAILAFRRSLVVSKRTPHIALTVELNLAYCLSRREIGDPHENLKMARRYADSAFRLAQTMGGPAMSARAAAAIGEICASDGGSSARDEAISWYRTALRLDPKFANPQGWAGRADHLAGLLAERSEVADDSDWREAVELQESALQVYAEAGDDYECARVRHNLAMVLRDSKDPAHQERAHQLLVLSLQGRPRHTVPLAWAHTAIALACVWVEQGDPEGVEKAVELLDEALIVASVGSPRLALIGARNLGLAYSRLGRWELAADAYLVGVRQVEDLYVTALAMPGQERRIADAEDLWQRAFSALVRCGRPKEAVLILERGRARLMGDRLDQKSMDLSEVRRLAPWLHTRYEEAVHRVRSIELDQGSENGGRGTTFHDTERVNAAIELRLVVEDIRKANIRRFLIGADEDTLREAVSDGVPLLYAVATGEGSCLVAVSTGRQGGNLNYDSFVAEMTTEQAWALLERLKLGNNGAEIDTVTESGLPKFASLLSTIRRDLLDNVELHCSNSGVSMIRLVAAGTLGALPLHAALIDRVAVAYLPSARIAASARKLTRSPRPSLDGASGERLVAVSNGRSVHGPLPFAAEEVRRVVRLFGTENATTPDGAATKDGLLSLMEDATHVHLACHGMYNYASPLESSLDVGVDGELTLRDVLKQPRLNNCHLVVASACDSAVADVVRIPDEVIGLPSALLVAGARYVIGTLWRVNDISTALLMERFYQEYLRGHRAAMQPAMGEFGPGSDRVIVSALLAAQQWLRDVTTAELAELFRERMRESGLSGAIAATLAARWGRAPGDARPFADPVYWAPFVLVGA